jgi:hypothetical protein
MTGPIRLDQCRTTKSTARSGIFMAFGCFVLPPFEAACWLLEMPLTDDANSLPNPMHFDVFECRSLLGLCRKSGCQSLHSDVLGVPHSFCWCLASASSPPWLVPASWQAFASASHFSCVGGVGRNFWLG